jgi:alpha-ribazole phosphatase
MNLYLIRHTKVNVKPRVCYGQTDVDVAETFLSEAESIKKQIGSTHFDRIYSSPLKRCKKLSEYLFTDDIIFDDRLMELNFGNWEMQEWDKITDSEYQEWMNNYIETPCLNGESFRELHKRVSSFIDNLDTKNNKNVAIVAHGGTIRSILTYINNKDLKDAFNTNVDFGEIIKIKKGNI